MHRTRSSMSFDILHGIQFPSNLSSKFAYLSYFPPPPPVLPGPPPQRKWTCSNQSFSSTSCFISDDRNPPSLRTIFPPAMQNQPGLFNNQTSQFMKTSTIRSSPLSISQSISEFLYNQFTWILLMIIFLTILIFVIFLLLFFLHLQRSRRRSLSNSNYRQTNNDDRQSTVVIDNSKNKKFYHSLLPYRRKTPKQNNRRATTNLNDENNLLPVVNHESSVLEVIRLTAATGTHINSDEEDVL